MIVTPQNLQSLANNFAEILGRNFVLARLESYGHGAKSPAEQKQIDLRAHPLAIQWKALQDDIEKSEKDQLLRLSNGSIFALDLLDALIIIQSLRGHQRILDDLKNTGQFHSAAYEARVISQFVQSGATVEIVPEGREKSCDFRLLSSDGTALGVECKSLQETTHVEHVIWSSTLQKISQTLVKNKRNWRVRILAQVPVNDLLADVVCKEIVSLSQSNSVGFHKIADGCIGIECVQIAESGSEFEGGIHGGSDSEIFDILCKVRVVNGRAMYSEPKIVEIYPYEPDDQTNSILNSLKKAADQLPRGAPNVVYVQVPHRKGPRIQAVVDSAFDAVSATLRKNHTRINACVITGNYPSKILRNSDNPLTWIHTVIPNRQAASRLPGDIKLVGTNDLKLDLSSDEGTIVFEFSLDSPWGEQKGRSLYHHCSNDGLQQLRVWHSLDGKLRVDVHTSGIGRLIGAGQPHFLDREIHKVAASWSSTGVSIFVDGSTVTVS